MSRIGISGSEAKIMAKEEEGWRKWSA